MTPASPTSYWHALPDGEIQCDLCPRFCQLKEGQRGLCFVRGRKDDKIELLSYGKSSGFCIDPIEKKPLHHFYPGTPVLSFGTAGCNLACKFCQNWDISKSREVETSNVDASPEKIAQTAKEYECRSVAFTYNDPVIFHEYAIDVAKACRKINIHSVAVSAGYVCEKPRQEFYDVMDAANIDLKAFTDSFYQKICAGHLQPVLDTLLYIKKETNVWLEITTLLIPGENDSLEEIDAMTTWIYKNLGPDVPLHFSAFHPDWKMQEKKNTPLSTLTRSRERALKNGLHHVYTGNVHDEVGDSTYCSACHEKIIGRDWYELIHWALNEKACCQYCEAPLVGKFDLRPGDWGNERVPVSLSAD